MSRFKFIILLVFLPVCVVFAQEKTLSKEEAVIKALENNYGIEIAKNQVDIADNNASLLILLLSFRVNLMKMVAIGVILK